MTHHSGATQPYTTVPNDPWAVRQYRLSNGIRLFISPNHDEPRIFTHIAFRAGSKHDPPDTTGLAHYMEHMLFKGTRRIGALDWEREKEYLEQIADLYETYRRTTDHEKRAAIYRQIDQLSSEAAKLAAPGEYDRLAGALGANHTNAYTWVEQTVYVNEIPANELDRWLQLESERFRGLALRLFHTELETVYEEFNIAQDQDFRKVNEAIRSVLFPSHPYGTQTTIGAPEHLRNPSMRNILQFFRQHYVPHNMAILLAGDLDPDATAELAERHFGMLADRPSPPFTFDPQPALTQPVRREVLGKEAPYLMMAWRAGSAATDDPLFLTVLDKLLYNEQAGLLDVHLNQSQRLLQAQSWSWIYEDYSVFGLFGKPRQGQPLEEVEDLLLEQLHRLREGDFPNDLLAGVVNNLKLEELQAGESNAARVGAMTQMFILGQPWSRYVGRLPWMENLRKEDLVQWVRASFRPDHFVAIYKKQGEDPRAIKVPKPPITPVKLRRGALSDFGKAFLAHKPPKLDPRFADFDGQIHASQIQSGLQLDYVHNPNNELFRLDYIFDMGKASDRRLMLALLYLPYLGTGRYAPQALHEAFFRLGLRYKVYTDTYRSYVSLHGLDDQLEAGMELLDHLLHEVLPKPEALRKLVDDILLRREHAKQDRRFILHKAMGQYGMYGPDSPFRYRLDRDDLLRVTPEELTDRIRRLSTYRHRVHYFGPRPRTEVERLLRRHHRCPDPLREPPAPHAFPEVPTDRHNIYLVDFPLVQVDLLWLSRGTPHFDLEEHCLAEWYNEYFGMGLSSIVFQEIRESKALAYSTFARYASPARKQEAHYLQAYIGTQPDKLADAIPTLDDIMRNMPVEAPQIEHARRTVLRRLETETITPRRLYWNARSAWDRGYRHDLRRDVYRSLEHAQADTLVAFQREKVRNRDFHLLVLGQKDRLDLGYLESLGELTELDMETIFGY